MKKDGLHGLLHGQEITFLNIYGPKNRFPNLIQSVLFS